MNHKIVKLLVQFSLFLTTFIYADSQVTSSHIASLYKPKAVQQQQQQQQQTKYQADQHLRPPQPSVQHYQIFYPAHINHDIQNNQIHSNAVHTANLTNWSDPLMRMISGNANMGAPTTLNSPLELIVSGLKTFTTLLSGRIGNNGMDKVLPMQNFVAALFSELSAMDSEKMLIMARELLNIEINLLDNLKSSFLQRPLASRRSVSDLGIASITMLKGFVRTTVSSSEECMQKYMCEANAECKNDINGGNSIFCQLGSYATSYVLGITTGKDFEKFYSARQGENCQEIFVKCSAISK